MKFKKKMKHDQLKRIIKFDLNVNNPVNIFMSTSLNLTLMPFFLDINVVFILYVGLN